MFVTTRDYHYYLYNVFIPLVVITMADMTTIAFATYEVRAGAASPRSYLGFGSNRVGLVGINWPGLPLT